MWIVCAIGPSGIISVFRGRCGYSSRCRRKSLKNPKNGLFWPFLGVMSGQVHLILAFFGKNMSLIRGGTPPGGPPPGGYPPRGVPPRTLPQGVQTPCPNEILSPAAARIPTPTPKSYNVLDPLGTGEGYDSFEHE